MAARALAMIGFLSARAASPACREVDDRWPAGHGHVVAITQSAPSTLAHAHGCSQRQRWKEESDATTDATAHEAEGTGREHFVFDPVYVCSCANDTIKISFVQSYHVGFRCAYNLLEPVTAVTSLVTASG